MILDMLLSSSGGRRGALGLLLIVTESPLVFVCYRMSLILNINLLELVGTWERYNRYVSRLGEQGNPGKLTDGCTIQHVQQSANALGFRRRSSLAFRCVGSARAIECRIT